ncbi:helix-turn-helix domain-containing protein [Ramlibacter tataouinensis]|uniref:IclR family transcriptional regulator n=1 Tax=Ramlibacter tataouinensis TaxID=94132 RepID=UPI0022F3CEA6|nr:helix-turn-helix domain-containing protein [Ramlibacter tataouinensis]WBY02879.1 helix-turn-helix domain-containing protein [Ramlibacter tataouinensis]
MPRSPARSADGPPGAQAIGRAAAVLAQVARHHVRGLPLRELVELTGLDRTTAWRIASALQREALVQRDESGLYRLGLGAMAIGAAAMDRPPMVDRCRPVMKTLARLSGDNVFLVVRHGDHSLCLHLEEGANKVRSFPLNVGATRLLGLGVGSIALLARLSDEAVAQHYARHAAEYGLHEVGRSRLLRWAAATRQAGYSYAGAGGVTGVGLGFPLEGYSDAAMSVLAPRTRLPRVRAVQLAAAMREECRKAGLA